MAANQSRSAIIYARFSTPSQEKGDSLDRQLRDCRAFCKSHGLTIVDEVADLGRSAYKGDHLSIGNLGKLSDRIMSGDVAAGTVLVVEKMDRLSRQKPRVVQRWIEDICDRGLRIAICDPERWIDAAYLDEGSNTIALVDILMNSHAANIFSKNLSDRISRSWAEKRKKAQASGLRLTRTIPAWLYVDDAADRIRVHPERGAIVRRIYEMTAEGIGAWTIANTFNQEGIEPWGAVRKQKAAKVRGWNSTYVRQVILHPAVDGDHHLTAVVGKRRKRGAEVLRGYFPMIDGLDSSLIARARSVVQSKGHASGGRFAPYGRNLFSEIARCAACGSPMTLTGRGVHSDKPAYLQCSAAKKRKGCESRSTFDYKALERSVLAKVLTIALNEGFFKADDEDILRLSNVVADHEKSFADTEAIRRGYSTLLARRPDDIRLAGDYDRMTGECDRLEHLLAAARLDLTKAKGATDPVEHLRRVGEVIAAMSSADEDILRTARRRVQASLKEVVYRMECVATPRVGQKRPDKTVSIALANGLIFYTFDNAGNLLTELDMRHDPAAVCAIRAEIPQMTDAIMRRTKSEALEGTAAARATAA